MISFPPAKINLGLNVVERRPDGYHNLETVFYPLPLCDALEINEMHPQYPTPYDCDLKTSNITIEGDEQQNLIVRAYQLLKKQFPQMPRIHAHLFKRIPTQAGMGGGSSDCAYTLLMLNEMFGLSLTSDQLSAYAAQLGADCPFFILSKPAYAEGIGERLSPVSMDLSNYYIAIVRPDIPVPTRDAFALITPHAPQKNCRQVLAQSIDTWRDELVNDFEQSVFKLHPEIAAIKEKLYSLGARYAAMSGSGSAVFGIFAREQTAETLEQMLEVNFPGMYTYCCGGKLS